MRVVATTCAVLALAGCGGGGGSGTTLEQGRAAEGFAFTPASAVAEGRQIDPRYTCDGEGVPPALAWKGVPDGTAELALVVEDPDAPGGTFTHWLVWGIDQGAHELRVEEKGWSAYAPFPEGKNDFGGTGYGGPCPPKGDEHRYVFRLLALHFPVELERGADRAEFDQAVAPHVLAEVRLVAPYARQG